MKFDKIDVPAAAPVDAGSGTPEWPTGAAIPARAAGAAGFTRHLDLDHLF